MLRKIEIPLLEFCAKQHPSFCAQDWLDSPLPSQELGVAAVLLAHLSWYGHRDELIDVGRQLNPEAERDLVGQMRQTELYPARFVQTVQRFAQLSHHLGLPPCGPK